MFRIGDLDFLRILKGDPGLRIFSLVSLEIFSFVMVIGVSLALDIREVVYWRDIELSFGSLISQRYSAGSGIDSKFPWGVSLYLYS
jgi:hypothetical protein